METISFASASEIISYDSAGTVPVTETDALILKSADYDSSSVVSVGGNTQATLLINFTKGSLTNVIIKMYGSQVGNPTASDWYTENEETSTTGTITLNPLNITLTADTKGMWHFPIGALKAYKITVTGTGVATSSSLKLSLGLRSN